MARLVPRPCSVSLDQTDQLHRAACLGVSGTSARSAPPPSTPRATLSLSVAAAKYARIAQAVRKRVQTLSEALQALTMVTLSALTFSLAQLRTDDVASLALASAPGAVLGAVALAQLGR